MSLPSTAGAPRRVARFHAAGLALCLGGFSLGTTGFAAESQVVISLSGSGTLPSGAIVDDEELVAVGPLGPRCFLNDQTLALYLGDPGGDGLYDEPNDVDALELSVVSPGLTVAEGVYFSLVSDQAGVMDGSIARFAPSDGGVEILFDEAFLVGAVMANDGNIDVDAIAFKPDGTVLFSLAEDESVGSSAIVIQDETVFQLPPGSGQASVLYSAAEMEQFARVALGSTSLTIGDVKGLEYVNGTLLFTVQSPSEHDATVFSTALGGTIHDGLSEGALGFQNQVEADALALFDGLPFPCLDLSSAVVAEQQPVTAEVTGLSPDQPFLVLVSTAVVPQGSAIAAKGFGALVPDPADPLFLAGVQSGAALVGVSGPDGRGSFSGIAPAAGGATLDLAIQVMDGATGHLSSPVVLELNQ